jgi:hypothetical protein
MSPKGSKRSPPTKERAPQPSGHGRVVSTDPKAPGTRDGTTRRKQTSLPARAVVRSELGAAQQAIGSSPYLAAPPEPYLLEGTKKSARRAM